MTLPKSAKRVFKGEIFDVWQWPQKMFDGSFETFERVVRKPSVVIIATVKNKLVVLKQKQPGTPWFYCTPSGRLDIPGESPSAAAKRELLEETGMKAKKFFLWKHYEDNHLGVAYTFYFYIARDCTKVAEQKLDAGEKIKVGLMSFDEYLHLSDDPKSLRWLGESTIDMLKARIDPKYKKYLKKTFFG